MTDSKALVRAFFEAVGQEGLAALPRFATQDVIWSVPGLGVMSEELRSAVMARMGEHLAGPMTLTVQDVISEGDRVAAEVESRADLKDGRVYHNHYHFKFFLRDGKIAEIKEYNDTKHALEIWGDPFAS